MPLGASINLPQFDKADDPQLRATKLRVFVDEIERLKSSFEQAVESSDPVDHGGLTGLGDDDHPQYGQLADPETVAGAWAFTNTSGIQFDEFIFIKERAAGPTAAATFGYFWVDDAVPNLPFFRNDASGDQLIDPSLSEINEQNGDYTLVLADKGKTIHKVSGGSGETITIPANSSVAYPDGTMICIQNDGGGTLTVAITSDTLTFADDNTTGSRIIGDGGLLILQKVTATGWKCTGAQVT